MFREMRRKEQLLSEEETNRILVTNTSGVLALTGDDGYPYAVPLSFVYENGKIYFHCAKDGHKIDAIRRSDKVSFCVIGKDEIIPQAFNTIYSSVIAFGRAKILTSDSERLAALESLIRKYSTAYVQEGQKEIEKYWDRVCLVEISIEHVSGKASREFYAAT